MEGNPPPIRESLETIPGKSMACPVAFFYITTPDEATAHTLARQLLEERLIGCANILPAVQSLYWWEGAIETATEWVLILKTRSDLADILSQRITALHPYETPCIAQLSLQTLHSPYQDWLLQTVTPHPTPSNPG